MDDLDCTEKTPREFDDEDATTGVGGDDIPIHIAAPMRAGELAALPPARAARGTRTRMTIPPPIPVTARRATTLPPPLPGRPPRAATVHPPLFSTTIGPSKLIPFLPPADDADAPSSTIVAPPPAPARSARAASPSVVVVPLPPPFPRPPVGLPPRPLVVDEPHLTSAPLSPLADLESESDETEYFNRSEPQPKRNIAGIAGIAVGALVVIVVLGLGLRGGSGDKVAASATPPARLEAVTPPIAKPVVAPRPAPARVAAPATVATAVASTALATRAPVAAAPAVAAPVALPTTAPVAAVAPAPVALATTAPAAPAPIAIAAPRAPAPAAVASSAAPAPVAIARVATAPVVAPETSSLPITSEPSGAIVTLIADGNATVVGRTPVTAVIDPSHTYDVVVALRDHPTKVTHIDPRMTRAVAFDLVETAAPVTVPTPTRRSTRSTAPTRSTTPKSVATAAPKSDTRPATKKSAEPATKTPAPKTVATASPVAKPAAVPAGSGVLMVSAKPPCEIAIDGKITHLVTPQRAIALAAGTHAVTLVNAQQKITKTFSVKIVAKQPTKLIQDFTHR